MKRRLLVLVAIVGMLSTVIAGPVSAKEPLRGDQVMTLNQEDQGNFGLHGCPEIAWFGTVVLDDTTYGMALYPIGSVFPGTTQHWEEDWKILTGQFKVGDDGLIDCEPGDVVLSGHDKGVIAFVTPKFHSIGIVEYASTPFEEWDGRRLHQDGMVGLVSVAGLENVFGFTGSLRFN